MAAQESGLELDENYREEDIFELQHHHLLRCLEKTTVSKFNSVLIYFSFTLRLHSTHSLFLYFSYTQMSVFVLHKYYKKIIFFKINLLVNTF